MAEASGLSAASLDARDLLVEALIGNGRGQEPATRLLAEAVLKERRSMHASDDAQLGVSVRNLGSVLFQAGDYEGAATYFREALRIHDEATGTDPSLVVQDLERLSRALFESEHFDEALAAAERGLVLSESITGAATVDAARTLQALALVRREKGAYAKARADLERAVGLLEAAFPTGHPETADALTWLGWQLSREGELVESRAVLIRAASMAEAKYRPDHPSIAFALRSLAISVSNMGDFPEAIRLCERALSMAEASFGSDHPMVAVQLNDLANILLLNGAYLSARARFERALAIYTQRYGATSIGAAAALYNLALVNGRLGDLAQARRQLQQVRILWAKLKGPEHPDVALAQWALGYTFAEQGRHREAIPFFRRALALQERTLSSNHPYVALTLWALSESLARTGALKRAHALSQRALDTWNQAPAQAGLADGLMTHGEILTRMGDAEGARQAYRRALDLNQTTLGSAHPKVAAAEVELSAATAVLGNRAEAITGALRGEHTGLAHLRLMLGSLPERQALDYAATRPKGLDVALSLLPQAGQAAAALDALVLQRSVVQDEIGIRQRSTMESANPTMTAIWEAFRATRQRLANLVIKGPDDRQPAQYLSLLADAEREKERTERMLAERSAEFRSEVSRSAIGLDGVREHLPKNSALVSFVRYDRRILDAEPPPNGRPAAGARYREAVPSYAAFVLKSDDAEPSFVPLGSAGAIDALVSSWRRELMDAVTRAPDAPRTGPSLRSLGLTLRKRVWDPLTAFSTGVDRVFVVPDGSLNLVAIAALPGRPGRYLLEDGPTVHYLSAERDLVPAARPSAAGAGGLLAMGGPAFSDASSFARRTGTPAAATVAAASSSTPFRAVSANCLDYPSLRFEALPASRAEAEAVAALWRRLGAATTSTADAVTLLTGSRATERAFKTSGVGHRVLHLATHGFFLDDSCAPMPAGTQSVGGLVSLNSKTAPKTAGARMSAPRETRPENPLLLSGLALAGANRRAAAGADEDDGILTAEEVASLNLEGVEWAVLSACDTGLGAVTSGEGVLGLRRAFQVAGVRTVIMSLWPVEDRAARQWMEALYKARLGQQLDTADAVREASLQLIRDRRARGQSTHPFYWAAFVAAGDWR